MPTKNENNKPDKSPSGSGETRTFEELVEAVGDGDSKYAGQHEMEVLMRHAETAWARPATPEEALVRLAMAEGEFDSSWNTVGYRGVEAHVPKEDRLGLETTLYGKLQTGELVATGCVEPGIGAERVPINPDLWNFLVISFRKSEAYGEDQSADRVTDLSVAAMLEADDEYIGAPFVRYLLIHKPPESERRREAAKSLGAARGKCEVWIRKEAESGAMWKKHDLRAAALTQFKGLTGRQFDKAWDEYGSPEWKRHGPKSKRANRITDSNHKES
jgi:hypothetical protein